MRERPKNISRRAVLGALAAVPLAFRAEAQPLSPEEEERTEKIRTPFWDILATVDALFAKIPTRETNEYRRVITEILTNGSVHDEHVPALRNLILLFSSDLDDSKPEHAFRNALAVMDDIKIMLRSHRQMLAHHGLEVDAAQLRETLQTTRHDIEKATFGK